MERGYCTIGAVAVVLLASGCQGGERTLGHADDSASSTAIPTTELALHPGEFFPRSLYDQSAGCGLDPSVVWNPSQKVLSDFEQVWFSSQLAAAGEKPLPEIARSTEANVLHLRFVWLPTFDNPVIVRLSAFPDGSAQLHAVRLSGAGGYEPGEVADRVERPLQQAEWTRIQRLMEHRDVLGQRRADCEVGLDGSEWIVEAIDAHGYHFIKRWSPDHGPVREFGELLLKTTGWRFGDIY